MHDDMAGGPNDLTASTVVPEGYSTDARPPDLIAHRYRVIRHIDSGGSSLVYRARDERLERVCALKISIRVPDRPDAEARLAASLDHPNIVAVYDRGVLPDGRVWIAMKWVDGENFGAVIDGGTQTRRALIEQLQRVSLAVTYAHDHDVVHRDLKPSNIRVDRYGSVFVFDWGIAERIGVPGARVGTPGYIAPEQRDGAVSQPTMDVFSLGRLLARILDAHTIDDRASQVMQRLVVQCTALDPASRLQSAQAFATRLGDWLEGVQQRAEADELVERADKALARAKQAWARSARERLDGATLLNPLSMHAPAQEKHSGWAAEDAADETAAQARQLEVNAEALLQEALRRVDSLPAALERLGTLALTRLRRAERAGDRPRIRDARLHLTALNGPIALHLERPRRVQLKTRPAGAQIFAARFEMSHRRLVPGPERCLGRTPLETALSPGSYQLRVVAGGRAPVILPLLVDAAHDVDNIAPGEIEPRAIWLPETLGSNESYVPAGWFLSGGDELVGDGLAASRVWVDGFIMQTTPLTCGALLDGLHAMHAADQGDLVEVMGRRTEEGDGFTHLVQDPYGRFEYRTPPGLDVRDWPATKLDWHAARVWARWRSRQTGQAWRLPDELEREKAARGVDGRMLPWGDYFEPTWACGAASRPGAPQRGPAHQWPSDVSVYGVLGLCGNVRDWCRNPHTTLGECLSDRLQIEPVDAPADYRIIRGGFYAGRTTVCRPAARFASPPAKAWTSTGVRLVRSVGLVTG